MFTISSGKITTIARAGLTAKGVVYLLLGILAFMASFKINGKSTGNTNMSGVFDFIQDQSGGKIVLGALAIGLACYFLWRMVQAFTDSENKGKDAKGLLVRARYFFSGLIYGSLALQVTRILLFHKKESSDNSREMAQELLSKPMGQWLVGIAALLFVAAGLYQIWYGLSEKYKKHVDKTGQRGKTFLLIAGKTGYVSRGLVWLLIAYLFFQAAFDGNSNKAGDTSKAFGLLSSTEYGQYFLAAIGVGLCCYGIFNFIRAMYEDFD